MEMLVVQSKVKEAVKNAGMNMAGDFAGKLSEVVKHHIDEAAKRAKANQRKTVRASDL
ncbi:DUF1931 domain-containing protein [Candidatus Woesearchaeota archaeon]|nr:DUF1931 domain-containing protein [Candidatus Woesearchaeota archaeon]